MTLTINENGKAVSETIDEIKMPVDYSLEKVNDFVHRVETHFEDLQSLCLGMAAAIESALQQEAETRIHASKLEASIGDLSSENDKLRHALLVLLCEHEDAKSLTGYQREELAYRALGEF